MHHRLLACVSIIVVSCTIGATTGCAQGEAPRTPGTSSVLTEFRSRMRIALDSLDRLGFFRYVPIGTDVEALKATMAREADPRGAFGGWLEDVSSSTTIERRQYGLDGEALFEVGGFAAKLKELRGFFDAVGVEMALTDVIETWDEQRGIDHRFRLNGREHVVFEAYRGDLGWGLAAKRFAEILDMELRRNGVGERVHLMLGGNDGAMMLLTPEQFQVVDELYADDDAKFLPVDRWSRRHGL